MNETQLSPSSPPAGDNATPPPSCSLSPLAPAPLSPSRSPTLRPSLAKGLSAARANLLPGVILWMAGVLVLTGYYTLPSVNSAMRWVGDVKEWGGFFFAAISTATFGGLIPVLLRPLSRTGTLRDAMRGLPFLLIFWAIKGVEVDLLYRGQAALFGNGRDVITLTLKTLVDQGVYVPLWAIPTTVFAFFWRDCGYSLRATRRRLGRAWYRRRVLPVLLANLGLWTPMVLVIYALPLPLQLPVQNLVLCLWSLMLIFLTAEEGEGEGEGTGAEELKG